MSDEKAKHEWTIRPLSPKQTNSVGFSKQREHLGKMGLFCFFLEPDGLNAINLYLYVYYGFNPSTKFWPFSTPRGLFLKFNDFL